LCAEPFLHYAEVLVCSSKSLLQVEDLIEKD